MNVMSVKGNKNAVGNDGGRPRIHDREALREDLLKWSKLMYSINLNAWSGKHEISYRYVFKWAKEDPVFRESLEIAKANIAANREELLCKGALHPVAYSRSLHMYDPYMYNHWKKEKRYEGKIKSKAEKEANRDLVIKVIQKPWKDD